MSKKVSKENLLEFAQKFASSPLIRNNYVTPEMFGAKGDGVANDTDAVQSALNSGKPVYAINVYKIKDVVINNSFELYGGTYIDAGSSDYIFSMSNVSDCVIDGILLDGKNTSNGISLSYCHNIEIRNCEVENIKAVSGTNGIYINRSSDVLIDRCLIHDIANENSAPTRGILSNRSIRTIIRNTIVHDVVSGDDGDGIQIIFDGVPQDETNDGCIITECTLYNCSKRYIKIQQRNCLIEKCKLIESQSDIQATDTSIAIYDCDCIVRNNYINGKSPAQIVLIGSMYTDFSVFENLSIVDNVIITDSADAYSYAIATVSSPGVPFQNIIIKGNKIIGGLPSKKTGIQFRNSSGNNLIVSDNIFIDVSYALYFRWDTNKPNVTVNKLIFAQNICNVISSPVYVQNDETSLLNAVITGNSYNISTGIGGKMNVIVIGNASYDRNNIVINNNVGNGYDGWNRIGYDSVRPSANVPDGFVYFTRSAMKPITYYNGSWYNADGTIYS